MLFRFALAALASLFACSDEDPGVTVPDLDGPAGDATLHQVVSLSGPFADQIRIVGDAWHATGPGQPVELSFELVGAVRVRQFDITVVAEPAAAFDVANAVFVLAQPFVSPLPRGVDVQNNRIRAIGASLTGDAASTQSLGTLKLTTASGISGADRAQLAVDSLSIGTTRDLRDNYGSALQLGVVVE